MTGLIARGWLLNADQREQNISEITNKQIRNSNERKIFLRLPRPQAPSWTCLPGAMQLHRWKLFINQDSDQLQILFSRPPLLLATGSGLAAQSLARSDTSGKPSSLLASGPVSSWTVPSVRTTARWVGSSTSPVLQCTASFPAVTGSRDIRLGDSWSFRSSIVVLFDLHVFLSSRALWRLTPQVLQGEGRAGDINVFVSFIGVLPWSSIVVW